MSEFDSVWSVMSNLGDFDGCSGSKKKYDKKDMRRMPETGPEYRWIINQTDNITYVVDGGIVTSDLTPNPHVPTITIRNLPGRSAKHKVIVDPNFVENYNAFKNDPDRTEFLLPYKIRLSEDEIFQILANRLKEQALYVAANSNMNFVKRGKVIIMATKVTGSAYILKAEADAFEVKMLAPLKAEEKNRIAMMNEFRRKHCTKNEKFVQQKKWKIYHDIALDVPDDWTGPTTIHINDLQHSIAIEDIHLREPNKQCNTLL